MSTTGQSAVLMLAAAVGSSAGSALPVTGKGDFVGVGEVDLAVSSAVAFAVDAARLLIVSIGDGWVGASAARNV